MPEQYKLIHPIKYFRDYVNKNIRPDGREFDKFRPVGINLGSISTSDGSAVVKIGNTSVVCGIRAELAKPKASSPENGFFIPKVDLHQIYSFKNRTQSGPSDESDALSCVIHNVLANSNCLNLKELCIYRERLVWALYCDIFCFDDDGCVVDAALIACVAALKVLELPKIIYEADINRVEVDVSSPKQHLTIRSIPISTSLMLFEDNIIVTDPTADEEKLSSATINIAVCNGEVCFILKSGGFPLSKELMDTCINRAIQREKNVFNLINKLTK